MPSFYGFRLDETVLVKWHDSNGQEKKSFQRLGQNFPKGDVMMPYAGKPACHPLKGQGTDSTVSANMVLALGKSVFLRLLECKKAPFG